MDTTISKKIPPERLAEIVSMRQLALAAATATAADPPVKASDTSAGPSLMRVAAEFQPNAKLNREQRRKAERGQKKRKGFTRKPSSKRKNR